MNRSGALPPDLAAAVALGGEMGRRFAAFDWAAHPLGPPKDWPVELRTTVATTLTSRFPIVLWLGPQDLFLVYNDAYVPIFGDRHPASLGRRGREVWWDIWDQIGPMLDSVVTTGQATWSDDLLLPIVTGGRRQERRFTFSYGPLLGDGKVHGVFAAVSETTERVLSQRRMHVLNAVAAAVMETRTIDDAVAAAVAVCAEQPADLSFVAVYVSDPQTGDITLRGATSSVLSVLPSSLAAVTEFHPTGRSRAEAQVIDDVAAVIPGIQALGDDCPEPALVLPVGEEMTAGALVIGLNPLLPFDTQYRGFCELLADQLSSALASAVSYEQQRQRAEALAELDRAKTAFLTNVSHEFRTPLTLLLGPLEDALAETEPESVLAERLSTARRNAQRLQRLVDSLLDFSRIESGRAAARLVCTDVGALTAHIASSFTELCQRAGLDLVIDCSRVLADVDPDMCETIVLNLLSNAVKYTLQGTISVEARSDSEACRVSIRDTGVGMAEDDLKRLGERFFRADTARGRSVEGTGIGLSLVHGLVELLHGTVEVESEPDRGTSVTIRLPLSLDTRPVEHSPAGLGDNPYVVEASQWLAAAQQPDGSLERRRELVLIADDNADMRAHLQRVLSPRWDTVLVADGESALKAMRELRPDAVVTDVMMPELDGFSFVGAIRADPELAATPVLMLSARAGAEAVSEGYAGGADDYLPKPFRSQELIDRVAARLSAASRERASRRQREAEVRRAAALAELDTALQSADSLTEILDALSGSSLGGCDVPAVISLGVLDRQAKIVRFEFAGAVPAEYRDRYHVASLDAPLVPVDVIKTGEPMIVPDTFALSPRYQHIVQQTESGVRACVSQPLRDHGGRVIGSLGLLWRAPRHFDPAELDMFARTAEITQSALDRICALERERHIAVEFQEQLLDLDRGQTAAVVAAVYQPAGEAMRVGGDWYLVTPLDRPGRVGISVGDVVGHGLSAAIVMSRLRAAVAATALTQSDPAAVLSVLDRYAATVAGGRCATVTYAVVDAHSDIGSATLRYSSAGHPYPLLVPPDGPPVFLQAGRRPPVAARATPAADHPAQTELVPGSLILLYTDGLIERPGNTLDHGFARLREAAAHCADRPVGDICAQLLERMRSPGGYTDDVVLLALRPRHSTARSLATVVFADPSCIRDARQQLGGWLTGIGVDASRKHDIVLATAEAVTNAIAHGSHCDSRRTVSVEAFLRGDTVAATVSDSGQWSDDSAASLRSQQGGRGLTLINALTDHVDTVRTAHGTRVTLQFDHAVAR
ncbi:SpoIIE family protein phosphatase [uncultured Mycobacterium sp.]|uniref:SpoIIE family protein phosphatase n=1 Tax=uncultured Mycobacterium sp. TaxID=171292 RepID=UPI0035CB6289